MPLTKKNSPKIKQNRALFGRASEFSQVKHPERVEEFKIINSEYRKMNKCGKPRLVSIIFLYIAALGAESGRALQKSKIGTACRRLPTDFGIYIAVGLWYTKNIYFR